MRLWNVVEHRVVSGPLEIGHGDESADNFTILRLPSKVSSSIVLKSGRMRQVRYVRMVARLCRVVVTMMIGTTSRQQVWISTAGLVTRWCGQ
jgi:hypothetical protein